MTVCFLTLIVKKVTFLKLVVYIVVNEIEL